ncbi:hypothetical protein KFL_008010050 [Klebsormidium nitens]|uniref:Uncharacterized protein n=1 Tax=Klebsormidium nitens TaxID=105231 RepID=A0A1Y1IL03_KLENI|nr:hypothetical protein KFL_008010050 [Klebsormidium nitens]|eukprot:GAQ91530.1 hypothetical protein KFL_008010050 [Klebsormidium nitens]
MTTARMTQNWHNINNSLACRPESLLDFVGKEYGVFTEGFDEEKVASGELSLGHDWDTLSAEAKHAVGELAQHLVDDGLETGILYTRKVLWEVELGNSDPNNLVVCIGEPVTASDTKPSMAEVVFALVHERLVSERQRKEDEEEDAARAASAREGTQSG